MGVLELENDFEIGQVVEDYNIVMVMIQVFDQKIPFNHIDYNYY